MPGLDDQPDQGAVLAFLERSETYGIRGPVERIDTHASVIFLAADRAYKLKRAVRLSYLDFSTVAKRRAICQAEVTLNRRTAPELYTEVRSIGRLDDGRLAWNQGTPIDWVVVMRRFDADCLLDTVAMQGRLDLALTRAIADRIASFHDAAEVTCCDDGAERLRRVIEGNRASMSALPAGTLAKQACDELHSRSLAEWAKQAALLDRRGCERHVRHCHGDLHLANICLWRGKPTLFDCLEFDAELARIDVLYDLAFLVMDLWQRGFRGQASLLFNRYLDMRDEGDGLAALPLFLSIRAAVRAHVNGTAATDQCDEASRRAKAAAAGDYLAAALAFLDRPRARLLAIGGLSGTGKSTLASAISPLLGGAPGARWLRTDVLRKRLAGLAPEERLPQSAYRRQNSATIYQRLAEGAGKILAGNYSVVVDGVFAAPEERAQIAAVAREAGVPFIGIWLEASRDTLLQRVTKRVDDASDADAAVVAHQATYDLGDLGGWHRIDAGGTPDAVLEKAMDHCADHSTR
jgi:aminoglycoside phosphotransferase family enzyme/predicted kinase